jgi:hypothetical protein
MLEIRKRGGGMFSWWWECDAVSQANMTAFA